MKIIKENIYNNEPQRISEIQDKLAQTITYELLKHGYCSEDSDEDILKFAQDICTNADEYLTGDDFNFIDSEAKVYHVRHNTYDEYKNMRDFYGEFDAEVKRRALEQFKKETVTENLSKEDTNVKIDKNYLKNLQRNHSKHNKKYKTSRSILTKVDAGNVPLNIAMFNHMNTPQGKPINPFNFDGSSLITNAMTGDNNLGSADAGDAGAGGEVAGGMGEKFNFSDAWNLMNELDEGIDKYPVNLKDNEYLHVSKNPNLQQADWTHPQGLHVAKDKKTLLGRRDAVGIDKGYVYKVSIKHGLKPLVCDFDPGYWDCQTIAQIILDGIDKNHKYLGWLSDEEYSNDNFYAKEINIPDITNVSEEDYNRLKSIADARMKYRQSTETADNLKFVFSILKQNGYDYIAYANTFENDGKYSFILTPDIITSIDYIGILDDIELNESLLLEKDNRDGLKNLIAVKTKLDGGTGCIWYNQTGGVADTLSLSSMNLIGDSIKDTANRMRELMKEKKYNSFRLYNKSKVIYDSLQDVGNADEKGNEDWSETAVRIVSKSEPDKVTLARADKDGNIKVLTADGEKEFDAKKITLLSKSLYDLNDDKYLYYVSNGDKSLFNTENPSATPIGKSLGIKKETKFSKALDAVKAKTGVGIPTPDWGKRQKLDDYYWSYQDSNGNELWRVYIRADQAKGMDSTAISKEITKRMGNASSIRPSTVPETKVVTKIVLCNALGRQIENGTPVNNVGKYTYVIFVKDGDVVEPKFQLAFTLPDVKGSIDKKIQSYINSNDTLKGYTSAKNASIEFYDDAGNFLYAIDKYHIRRNEENKLLDGQKEYNISSKTYKGEEPEEDVTPKKKGTKKAKETPEEKVKDLVITADTSEIAEQAYKDNTDLETVEISDGVKKIGSAAFMGCSNLKKAIIPNSVTEIGVNVFTNCRKDITVYTDNETVREALKGKVLVKPLADASKTDVETTDTEKVDTTASGETETKVDSTSTSTTTTETDTKKKVAGAAGLSSNQIVSDIGKLNQNTRNKIIRDLINKYGDGTTK